MLGMWGGPSVVAQGFLVKKGGGTSLMGRTSEKKRYFTLYSDGRLAYFRSRKAFMEKEVSRVGVVPTAEGLCGGEARVVQAGPREAPRNPCVACTRCAALTTPLHTP